VENVAALLGRGLGTVLGDLAEIGNDAEWHCIPARAVGAFHDRDRIWIVAHPRGEQHEGDRAPFSGEIASQLAQAAANVDQARLEERQRQDADGARPDDWPVDGGSRQWATEPDVVRVVYGIPARMDRVAALGNAVVPQIPEIIGRAIMKTTGR
jgi:DNA (cytosine-5)-methyltransferase 1